MEMITVSRTCPICAEGSSLTVAKDQYDAWQNGMKIQDAFPNLSKSQREILMTGIDDKCWEEMWSD